MTTSRKHNDGEPANDVVIPPIGPCPKCRTTERAGPVDHPGTAFVECDGCGHRGPEVHPNRGLPDGKRRTLRAAILAWNAQAPIVAP